MDVNIWVSNGMLVVSGTDVEYVHAANGPDGKLLDVTDHVDGDINVITDRNIVEENMQVTNGIKVESGIDAEHVDVQVPAKMDILL